MTRTITNYEQGGVCGVVEGQPKVVDNFLTNAGAGLKRGNSRRSAIDDLVTNQSNVVKLTTYQPVVEPMGMPTMNDLFGQQVEHAGGGIALFDEPPKNETEKKKRALYIAGPPPTDNGPLGLPDMQWGTPPETAGNERPRTNTVNEPGQRDSKRQAKTGGGPLGLPSMDW